MHHRTRCKNGNRKTFLIQGAKSVANFSAVPSQQPGIRIPATHRRFLQPSNTLVAAVDCRFISKSGKQTDGVDPVSHRPPSPTEKGLEISTLAIVEVTDKTASHRFTHPTAGLEKADDTRRDPYLAPRQEDRAALPKCRRDWVADGYYRPIKFIDGVTALGPAPMGKLRREANLPGLYQGKPKPRGRRHRYDGKVRFDELTRWELAAELEGVKRYPAMVNRARFQRDRRLVYGVNSKGHQTPPTAWRGSTDLELAATAIDNLARARF